MNDNSTNEILKKEKKIIMKKIQKLINADCFKVLPKIKKNSVDLILIDPPYNMTANSWDKEKINLSALDTEFNRVLKEKGVILIFCKLPFKTKLLNTFGNL